MWSLSLTSHFFLAKAPYLTFSRVHRDVVGLLPSIISAYSELPIMFDIAALVSNAVRVVTTQRRWLQHEADIQLHRQKWL